MPDDPTITGATPLLSQLGPYRIECHIGGGGMGEVYRATDTRLHRTVAIKILPRDKMADPDRRRRFVQEARAACALNHPNIVTVYDLSSDQGIDFLVLEHVAGETLKQHISSRPLEFEDLLRYASQTAAALAAAHAAGIVHRDIKPANLMVTSDRQIKVLDFGLAKLAPTDQNPADLEATIPGMVFGTVAYMSPEQTRGETVDARSDIFSLGVVLYEAATGKLPWTGHSALELMHSIAIAEPLDMHALRPGFSRTFAQVVARCLQKQAADRFQSMDEVAEGLRRVERPGMDVVIAGRKTAAVLPFRILTADSPHQFLSAALADAVVNRLGATGKLIVRPVSSVLRYAQAGTEWTTAAREMNVDIVVEGSVQAIGTRVRVMVQAHQVADQTTLLSTKQDGDTEDLFGFQDRIAEAVCRVLAPEAAPPATSAAPTSNRFAYEFYMRAIGLCSHLTQWDTRNAIEMLEHATRLDPQFADAWARLAQACVQMGIAFDSDPRWFQSAEAAASRALSLDPANSEAHCARGQIVWTPSHGYQNAAALRALNASLRINPGCQTARIWQGLIYWHLGLYDDAERGLQEALAANPYDARTLTFLGQTALFRGDYEEAYDYNVRALSVDPASLWPNLFLPSIPIFLNRPGEAIERVQQARQVVANDPMLITVEAMAAAYCGDCASALRLAEEALARPQSLIHAHHLLHNAASVYAICGKPDSAIRWLNRCAESGLPNYLLFSTDPHLRTLHDQPDFQSLMARLRAEYDLYAAEFAGSAPPPQ